MQRKRLVSMLLVLTLAFGMTMQVQASSIEETKKKGEALEAEKSSAEAEKAELANQLNTLITKMDETTTKIQEKQVEICDKRDELIEAQVDEREQYESMKKRIKYMYENGNTQFIEILFESKSISDFLNNAEYITQISEYDRDMLVEFQNIVKDVEEQKAVLENEEAELEALQVELQAQQEEVSVLIEEKAAEISSLEVAIGENAAKLKALQEEAARQERLRKEREEAQRNNYGGGGGTAGASATPSGSGVLSCWPCNGSITSGFGGRNTGIAGASTYHRGVDFGASSGSPIYAAGSGTVAFVGYDSARGNYVDISHGNGLKTRYQHCSAIYVQYGQSVSAGQNIAAVGTTGISSGAHLHFEVHVNGSAVNPMNYL